MVEIIPFKALRFNTLKNEEISRLVSPPYDIISPAQKEELKTFSENNIVRLILPEDENDRDKYESAKNTLNFWIGNNILTLESNEAFYVFEESFIDNGKWKNFTAFIGLTKIEEYESLKILRHEYTLSKPKEDRLNLLRAANTNFGLIYTLYNDQNKKIQELLEHYKLSKPIYDFIPEYNNELKFRIWKIADENDIKKVIDLMENNNLLIADGHHRYETSRIFKHEVKEKRKNTEINLGKTFIEANQAFVYPEDYVLTMYVNFNQENIKILPTHRLIKFENDIDFEKIKDELHKYFYIESYSAIFGGKFLKDSDFTSSKKDDAAFNILDFMSKSKKNGKKSFCFYDKSKNIFFCTLKEKINASYGSSKEDDFEFENLDVRILHSFILEELLKKYKIKNIDFTHSLPEVIEKITLKNTDYDLGIILNAPEIKDVESLSLKGKVMPQKSTYFYPKPCSGLIMYKMDL